MCRLKHIFAMILIVGCSGIQPRYHTVRSGDSLESIARHYSLSPEDLKDKNSKVSLNKLKTGQKIYIPFERSPAWNEVDEVIENGEREEKSGAAPVPSRTYSPDDVSSVLPSRKEKRAKNPLGFSKFQWPVSGNISSHFGHRKGSPHEGIDIAAMKGTPVKAARSGHVIYSGNGISGYGNLIVVRHTDTFATVYAHLSKLNVKKGQFVVKSQLIGKVGSTGHSSGPHLHFEIREGRLPVDPLSFLPGQYAYNQTKSRTLR